MAETFLVRNYLHKNRFIEAAECPFMVYPQNFFAAIHALKNE